MAIFKKKDKKEKEILLDRRLLSYIQPKGGITYRDEKFISTGDTYICCIHIYEFPKTIGDFWLEKLMNIPNTIAIMDILTEDTVQVKKNINLSMKEQNVRYRESKDYSEKMDAEQLGAGEICLNSIDTDGVRGGFDLPMLKAVCDAVQIPVIASGGAGKLSDFAEAFLKTGCSAALAASLFHFRELTVQEVKADCRAKGIPMR